MQSNNAKKKERTLQNESVQRNKTKDHKKALVKNNSQRIVTKLLSNGKPNEGTEPNELSTF